MGMAINGDTTFNSKALPYGWYEYLELNSIEVIQDLQSYGKAALLTHPIRPPKYPLSLRRHRHGNG